MPPLSAAQLALPARGDAESPPGAGRFGGGGGRHAGQGGGGMLRGIRGGDWLVCPPPCLELKVPGKCVRLRVGKRTTITLSEEVEKKKTSSVSPPTPNFPLYFKSYHPDL